MTPRSTLSFKFCRHKIQLKSKSKELSIPEEEYTIFYPEEKPKLKEAIKISLKPFRLDSKKEQKHFKAASLIPSPWEPLVMPEIKIEKERKMLLDQIL